MPQPEMSRFTSMFNVVSSRFGRHVDEEAAATTASSA
jgi:hypothetical protein